MDEDIDEAEANEYANQWFALAATDGNGLIDKGEFFDFVEKLDENKSISNNDAKE